MGSNFHNGSSQGLDKKPVAHSDVSMFKLQPKHLSVCALDPRPTSSRGSGFPPSWTPFCHECLSQRSAYVHTGTHLFMRTFARVYKHT